MPTFFDFGFDFLVLLPWVSELLVVKLDVPLFKGSRVDLHNAVFNDSVGSYEIIIWGIVNHVGYFGLMGGSHRLPVEVALVVSQGSSLQISTSHSNCAHSFLGQFRVARLSSLLESSLLLVDRHSSSCQSTFVSSVSSDSHILLILSNIY